MSLSNKMCMLSNTPIQEGSLVKLFFLVAEGKYGNPIFKMDTCYPWDASTILGGISLNARYIRKQEYEVVDDIKSRYVLDILKENQGNSNLTFEDIFTSFNDGKAILVYPNKKNGYLKLASIHLDIYEKMVEFHKEKALKKIKPRFDHYINFRDNLKVDKNLFKNESDFKSHIEYRMELHAGFLKEYTTDLFSKYGRHPFANLKLNYDLSDNDAFDILVDDMIIMDVFFECSILLSERPLNDELSSRKLKRELFKKSHELLYNSETSFFFKTKYSVIIEQEVILKDIKKTFEFESYNKELLAIEDFEKKYRENPYVIIHPEDIKNIIFLSEYIEDKNIPVKIIFD